MHYLLIPNLSFRRNQIFILFKDKGDKIYQFTYSSIVVTSDLNDTSPQNFYFGSQDCEMDTSHMTAFVYFP